MLSLRRAWLPFLALLLIAVSVRATPWAHTGSDLQPNPSARFGTLENGLRFVVQQNPEPQGRVALRLLVRAGSLHEEDDERGLAHFVEHMAFSSTRRFPRNTLTDILQRHGMQFGADVSAFTFLTHTIYQLDVPVDPVRLDEGLQVLRDFSDGQLFDPAEVDRERGVVQSERRARDNWGARAGEARDRFLYPLSLIPRRSPIGDVNIVQDAGPADLRRFYERWYRADNMVVLAIGDLPLDELETRIRTQFATLARPTTPLPPAPDVGWVGNLAEVNAFYHQEPAAGAVTVELISLIPGSESVETIASRTQAMERDLVITMMAERMNQLRRDNARDFGAAHAIYNVFGRHHTAYVLHLDSSAIFWRKAVGALARECRRATEQGFSEEELTAAVRMTRRRYDYAVAAEPTESSRTLADQIAFSLALDSIPTTWTQAKALVEPVLAGMTTEKARDIARAIWSNGSPRITMIGSLSIPEASEELITAYKVGLGGTLPPLPHPQPAALAYAPAIEPGAIVSRRHVPDLDVHLVEFANGVQLNLKRTAFSRNLVQIRARVGRGRLSQPAKLSGVALLAATYLNDAGLGRHDNAEVQRFTAERNLSLNFAAEADAFTFTGASDTDSAPDLLLLLQAYLTDPAWRPKEFAATQARVISAYQELQHDPAAALRFTADRIISRDDSRLALAPYPETASRTLGELMTWIERELKNESLEVGLVGDFDLEATIATAARTIGALPRRPRPGPPPARMKPVEFNRRSGTWTASVFSPIRRSLIRVQWPVSGLSSIRQQRVIDTVAGIFKNRVRRDIREKLGATYDPDADIWNDNTSRDDGYLVITLSCKPEDAHRLSDLVTRIAGELKKSGATAEELEAEIEPRLAEYPTRLRNNSYWLYYIVTPAFSEPSHLDWPRTRERDLRSITVREVNSVASKLLHPKRAQIFLAGPPL